MSTHFPEEDERCTDVIDQACKVETLMRANDVALARAKAAPEQEQVWAVDSEGLQYSYWPVTECVDCDETIPEKRLALARIRCVVCQEKLEKTRRQHGHGQR